MNTMKKLRRSLSKFTAALSVLDKEYPEYLTFPDGTVVSAHFLENDEILHGLSRIDLAYEKLYSQNDLRIYGILLCKALNLPIETPGTDLTQFIADHPNWVDLADVSVNCDCLEIIDGQDYVAQVANQQEILDCLQAIHVIISCNISATLTILDKEYPE